MPSLLTHRREQKRCWRIRKKIRGTRARPRLSVRFTHQHIYVQFIDDEAGVTLASTSTRTQGARAEGQLKANAAGGKRVGAMAAEVARAAGISEVVFDRSGARYHGKVKALADAARAGGLKF